MSEPPEKHLVFAAMRNEGAFIVEWVCWYRMLGFDILIGFNDCTDRSPELLTRLAEEGVVSRFSHRPAPGLAPKHSAYRALRKRQEVADCDWLLICDVDEFLVLQAGGGTIASYLDVIGRDHLGVAFHAQCFGTSGQKSFEDIPVHRRFTRTGPRIRPQNAWIKTMIHKPLRFNRFSDHSPVGYAGTWGPLPDCIVDGDGRPLTRFLNGPYPVRFTDPADITHGSAQLNHYVLRSEEDFDLKRGTPSASSLKDRYTEKFFRLRNSNGSSDLSALAYAERFDAVQADILALPGVRRLHHLCCADRIAAICAMRGIDPETDPRWQRHMQIAAAA